MSHDFKAMREQLRTGNAVQVAVAPQLYPTPPDVAARMVELLDLDSWNGEHWQIPRVLEPSAGTGNLLVALSEANPEAHIVAVELNAALAAALMRQYAGPGGDVVQGDFLRTPLDVHPFAPFDACIMNPPFERGAWRHHLRHAYAQLKPGGRLVSVLPTAPDVKEVCRALCPAASFEPLPANTFAGTGVNTLLALLEKGETP